MLSNMHVHIISKPFDIEQMRIGYIRNNSVGNQDLIENVKREIFQGQ